MPEPSVSPGLTAPQIARRYKIHRSRLERWIATGKFPPPDYRCGPRGWRMWRRATVDSALDRLN